MAEKEVAAKTVLPIAGWEQEAKQITALFEQVRKSPAVRDTIAEKFWEAAYSWAVRRMGNRRTQYIQDAVDAFCIRCALGVLQSGKRLEEVAKEQPFGFRLVLSKKREGFVKRLPEYFLYWGEYEATRRAATSAKSVANGTAHFRLLLEAGLPQPLSAQFKKRVANYSFKGTKPSQVALDYVACAHGLTSASVKKFVALVKVKDATTVFSRADKDILKSYFYPANPRQVCASDLLCSHDGRILGW